VKRIISLSIILALAACVSPAYAQNGTSNSPRVQGVPPGFGDPVQVTIRSADGSTVGAVAGDVAHDAVDSGNPVKVGGVAHASPAIVAQGDRANLWLSLQGATVISGTNQGSGADAASGNLLQAATVDTNQSGRLATHNFVFNGSTFDRQRGDTNGLVVQRGLSSTYWSYANGATGILSNTTTAVTIKAAAGASVRNYIDSCQINTTAFGTSVPIAIRDGAGGTVIFALSVPTAGFLQPINLNFDTPLRSTANTLLEVVTTTANTTGTAWVNCQGHTGP
jgi:hypothetical protein